MHNTEHCPEKHTYTEKLTGLCRSVDNYTKILIESMNYDLRQWLNAQIGASGKGTRFNAVDDKIYDLYLRLMRQYNRALVQFEDMADVLVSPRIKSVMDGIHSVIRSRLVLCTVELEDGLAENPIFLERRRIIGEAIEGYAGVFDGLEQRFASEEQDACLAYARTLFVTLADNNYAAAGFRLVSEIARRQEALMGSEALSACQDAMRECAEKLSSGHIREQVELYHDLLDAEQEILDSIVRIQIPYDRVCSPTEQTVAEGLMMPLIKSYDALVADMDGIHTQTDTKPAELAADAGQDTLWNDGMLLSVLAATNYNGFVNSLKAELVGVCRALEKEIGIVTEREISNKLFARARYEYRKLETELVIMADEMLAVFARAAADVQEFAQVSAAAIVNGITETLQIKIESLRENRQTFVEEMAQQLKLLRKQQPKLALRELGALEPVIDLDTRAAFFEKYRQRMRRHIADHQEFSSKKGRAFLKESLLFEMITFGEIMQYSVSRIRDDADERVRAYVESLDEAWDALLDILHKNNITEIAPEAHTPFNGKEHEVLAAESSPEFEKGEIIKLMNPGYKQDGTVLIRANVVAAR